MDDVVVGVVLVELEDPFATSLQPLDEAVPPIGIFDEKKGEVGGKPLAQPYVIPVVFGDGVSKPVVGDLMSNGVWV